MCVYWPGPQICLWNVGMRCVLGGFQMCGQAGITGFGLHKGFFKMYVYLRQKRFGMGGGHENGAYLGISIQRRFSTNHGRTRFGKGNGGCKRWK